MDDKWLRSSFLLGSSSLANHWVLVLMLSMATKIATASSCTQFGFMAKIPQIWAFGLNLVSNFPTLHI
jgi:hypothetical protein